MRYRLLGIDLDGTLLNRAGEVSEANRLAIAAARDAGMIVVPCTGRGWRESANILAPIAGLDLGVFVTGAVIAKIDTGESLDLAVIEPHLAMELVDLLRNEPEAVLVYREANQVGHDYLVTGRGTLTAQTEWWFQFSGATVHFQRDVTVDDLHHSLRVGLVASGSRLPALSKRVRDAVGDRVLLHHFAAVASPNIQESVHILEVFAQGVDKWRGLSWIARQRGIRPEQIATLGDEVNDLSMLEAAGCGIAMGNASDDAKRCAKHITEPNDQDGVARAIDRLLDGTW